jgi:hypothetical protein
MEREMTDNGWEKWKNAVLFRLDELNTSVKAMDEKNDNEHKEIRAAIAKTREQYIEEMTEVKAEVKYKSGAWGAIVAFLTTLGGLLIYFFVA